MAEKWIRFRKLSQEASEKLKVHSSLQQLSEATAAGSSVKTCPRVSELCNLLRMWPRLKLKLRAAELKF